MTGAPRSWHAWWDGSWPHPRITQTSDCDRGGLLKPWVVDANSQMSHLGFLPLLPEGRTLDCDSGGQTSPAQQSSTSNQPLNLSSH